MDHCSTLRFRDKSVNVWTETFPGARVRGIQSEKYRHSSKQALFLLQETCVKFLIDPHNDCSLRVN